MILPLSELLPAELCRAYVRNRQDGWDDWLPVEIGALGIYPGEEITAVIRAACGSVFFDLPLDGLRSVGADLILHPESSSDLVYRPCPDEDVRVVVLPFGDALQVYSRDRERIGAGVYHLSLSWPDANELHHLIEAGGRWRLWPPHKVRHSTDPSKPLPDWLKRRYDAPTRFP